MNEEKKKNLRRFKYYKYINSSKWRILRWKVIAKAGGICEHCKLANIEEIHHLTYKRFGNEHLSDLIGLCSDCHAKVHKIKNNHIVPLVFGGE